MFLRTEIPDHSANSGQEEHKTDHAPNDRSPGWTVTDQLFVRPVLRIGYVLTRPVRARCPCGPPEECSHLPLFCWIAQGPGGDCVHISPLPINVTVIARQFLKCRGAIAIDYDRIVGGVISILPGQFSQSASEGGARLCRH